MRLLPLDDERTLPEELLLEDDDRDFETPLLLRDEELFRELDRTELDFLLLVDFLIDLELEDLESDDFFVERFDLFMRTIFFPLDFESGLVR